jgi:hypothetical protein
MYELYALTVGEAMGLLLVLVAHGTLIGYLVRRDVLAVPRATPVTVAHTIPRSAALPPRPDRMAA